MENTEQEAKKKSIFSFFEGEDRDDDWKFGVFFVVLIVLMMLRLDLTAFVAWTIIYGAALMYFDRS